MIKNIIITVLVIGLIVVGYSALQSGGVGGESNLDTLRLSEDLIVDDDLTVSGGSFALTTANTATSSATIGCVQTYATSTATAVRFIIGSVATSSAGYGGTNAVGLVGWQYGSCPI